MVLRILNILHLYLISLITLQELIPDDDILLNPVLTDISIEKGLIIDYSDVEAVNYIPVNSILIQLILLIVQLLINSKKWLFCN